MGHALDLDEVKLVCCEHDLISNEDAAKINGLLTQRLAHEPVARILGTKEFYGLAFALNEATLVPRPETEMLVDRALEFLAGRQRSSFLELGFGSGCISIAIACNSANVRGTGVDLSEQAFECACVNAKTHGVETRINFICGSWFKPVPRDESYDLIVSNPPYIKTQMIGELDENVRQFDPDLALNGGIDGLVAYREIISATKKYLKHDGMLLLEIGFDQGDDVIALCQNAGFEKVELIKDLAGQARLICAS